MQKCQRLGLGRRLGFLLPLRGGPCAGGFIIYVLAFSDCVQGTNWSLVGMTHRGTWCTPGAMPTGAWLGLQAEAWPLPPTPLPSPSVPEAQRRKSIQFL